MDLGNYITDYDNDALGVFYENIDLINLFLFF